MTTRRFTVIQADGAVQVDATIVKDKSLLATTQVSQQEQWQLYTQDVPTTQPTPQSINGVADLRAIRIDQQLAERDDVACVYATYAAPPGERVRLKDVTEPKTAHTGVIRAVVPVQKQ